MSVIAEDGNSDDVVLAGLGRFQGSTLTYDGRYMIRISNVNNDKRNLISSLTAWTRLELNLNACVKFLHVTMFKVEKLGVVFSLSARLSKVLEFSISKKYLLHVHVHGATDQASNSTGSVLE